jgi:radical SAM protein with 4Fe4S-binding SPASM domain
MTYSPLRFIPSIFRKDKPVHFTFFITKRCNAKCPFCFYSKEKEPGRDEMSLREIKLLSPSLGNLLWLAFSGGEIYLREDLVDISRVFYENNKPSIMLFPTNGLTPELIRDRTVEILKHCTDSVVVVKLSLDGLEEKHDSLRGIPGSFKKVMKTYEMLGKLLSEYPNFELGINTVFCSANQDDMDEIIDFVKGLDMIKTHTISMIRGEIKDPAYKDIDLEKYLNAVKKLEENMKTYRFRGARIKAAQDILQRRLIYRTIAENRQLIPCYAGRLNLVLTETGDVFPCESFNPNHRFGNIRDYDYDIKKLLKEDRAKNIITSIKNGCFCSHECYMMTNILFNPKMYPALLKETRKIKS